jgi:8-oxo-dGTP pyrophosphatase MutT (NUDIX family)
MKRQRSIVNSRRIDVSVRADQSSETFVRLSHLRKLRRCQQVAAVCYRLRDGSIEFLLVRTRGSQRWTFPKGNAEPGMTHAQAAALEAFEEAGVHGRIEEASFARYIARKRAVTLAAGSSDGLSVEAHLCEVIRLGNPKESNRKRTWFSVEEARQCLREGRKAAEATAFARVVDKAVERIGRLRESGIAEGTAQPAPLEHSARQKDSLNRVRFEAPVEALLDGYLRRRTGEMRPPSAPTAEVPPRKLLECEVLQFASPQESKRNAEWIAGRKKPKALGTGVRG